MEPNPSKPGVRPVVPGDLIPGRETRLQGIPVSPGLALARVCKFNERRHSNLPQYHVEGEGVERESERFRRGRDLAAAQLESLRERVARRLGQAEAEIFVAQRMILEDAGLAEKILGAIAEGRVNAEAAVAAVLDGYERRLTELDDEVMRDRATDIGEVKRRLLDVLANLNPSFQCSGQDHCQKGRHRIVVAEELTPSLSLDLDTDDIRGFVTERGGKTSHAAILARALGIPAVTGLAGIHAAISCGTDILVNGDTGEVVVWPGPETAARFHEATQARAAAAPVAPVPGFAVAANISVAADARDAVRHQAEGIGLYRTEFEFFAAGRVLTEDEQVERYRAVLDALAGRPVTFRMLDLGGDKSAPFLDIPAETNPYLGFRGGRLLLGRPDLFAPQARALARASAFGPVRVLYPMVVDADQFRELRERFGEAAADIPAGNILHGAMFEVPAACLQAAEIFADADFGSIGTNDLIQYLYAVDRNNELVSYDYIPDRPALWTLVRLVADAACAAGKPVSICGEAAAEPALLERMLDTGIRSVSVSARRIPLVRTALAGRRL
jgi:phosphotransferase system enzyme I (PtsI)